MMSSGRLRVGASVLCSRGSAGRGGALSSPVAMSGIGARVVRDARRCGRKFKGSRGSWDARRSYRGAQQGHLPELTELAWRMLARRSAMPLARSLLSRARAPLGAAAACPHGRSLHAFATRRPALLRGADCGRRTTELELPRPPVAWMLCERIERAESASALPVLAPERPASMVY